MPAASPPGRRAAEPAARRSAEPVEDRAPERDRRSDWAPREESWTEQRLRERMAAAEHREPPAPDPNGRDEFRLDPGRRPRPFDHPDDRGDDAGDDPRWTDVRAGDRWASVRTDDASTSVVDVAAAASQFVHASARSASVG